SLAAPANAASYTLSLHDALPISRSKINSVSYANSYISHFLAGRTPASVESTVALSRALLEGITAEEVAAVANAWKSRENLALIADRKSTRLNSSHVKSRMPSSA